MRDDWLFWTAVGLSLVTAIGAIRAEGDAAYTIISVVGNLIVVILPIWGVRTLVRRRRRDG